MVEKYLSEDFLKFIFIPVNSNLENYSNVTVRTLL